MDPITLGQKVKAQYPQYQNLSDQEVGTKMMTKYPQYGQPQTTQPQQTPDNPVTGIGRMLGAGIPADMIGLAQAPGRAITGQDNPFFTNSQKQGFQQNPVGEVAKTGALDTLSGLGWMIGGPSATKPGVNAITSGLAHASDATVPVEELLAQATKNAEGKMLGSGVTSELKNFLMDRGLMAKKGEEILGGNPEMTMEKVLQARQAINKQLPSGIQNFFQAPTEAQRAQRVLSSTLSDVLHSNVGQTKIWDKLYHLYSTPVVGGDIPTLAAKAMGLSQLQSVMGHLFSGGGPSIPNP